MTTRQRLEALKTLINRLHPSHRHLGDLSTKGKCEELYGRPISDRTWQRWKQQVLAVGWTYADTVCLRFLAQGRAGNGQKGRHQRYSRESLIRDINRVIQEGDIETHLIPPGVVDGAELEVCLSSSLGNCSQRQWRNRGIHRRKRYTPSQVQGIYEKLLVS